VLVAEFCFWRVFCFSKKCFSQLKKGIIMNLLSSRRLAIGLMALLFAAGALHAQNALDDVIRSKKILIGVPADIPPYGSVGTDLKPQGLDIDMANYIAAKLGVSSDLVVISSANRIAYLQTKKVDLVISTLGKNPERERVIDFTYAYSPFFQGIFAAKTMALPDMSALAGKTIAVTRGSIEDQELTKVAPSGAQIKRFEDNNATVSAFTAGQVQVLATGVSTAGNMMYKNPTVSAEFKLLLKDSPNFIGVAKGEDKLRAKVNEIIAEAKVNGDLDKIAQKWLGRPAGNLPQ
jgi:polar amino acid transport system substrate-binding protein